MVCLSLPNNSNGQVSVSVKGRTLTNLWKNKYNTEGTFDVGTATGSYVNLSLTLAEVPLKVSTEYTVIFDVLENTLDGSFDCINP